MQKVVSISLNGFAYQLEEPGYERLRTYLERAELRLKESPDRIEVMADLEQAIGEKCARLLGAHKSVVSTAEVDRILEEMGPVESADEKSADAPNPGAGTPGGPALRKRLYKIREGAVWAGVCNGIGAYINVDVTWVRIAFALFTVFSTGIGLLVYVILAFVVPLAETPEDRAAAFGMPFSAEELITRAKKNAEQFASDFKWRREWRRQQRNIHRQWQQMNLQMQSTAAHVLPQLSQTGQALSAIFLPIIAILGAALFVIWMVALVSLVLQQSVFGWHLPHGIPMWVGVLILVLGYLMIAAPLRMMRQGGQHSNSRQPGWAFMHTVMWSGFAVLFFWAAYQFIPGVHELVNQLIWAADLTASNIRETIV